MRQCFIFTLSWLALTVTTAHVRAAAEDPEVVQLRQRVADLEKQNQLIACFAMETRNTG